MPNVTCTFEGVTIEGGGIYVYFRVAGPTWAHFKGVLIPWSAVNQEMGALINAHLMRTWTQEYTRDTPMWFTDE